jgi:hypothetical protein
MATKMRQKKYLHQEFVSEHYYQNQDSNKKGKKQLNKLAKNNNMIRPGTRSSGGIDSPPPPIPSSSASSNRPLINDHENGESDIAFCFLTLAIFCLVFSVISIAITFIFPFWFRITINNPDSQTLNLTNVDNNISLFAMSASNNTTTVYIDMGIWEVKMNQDLELVDNNSNRFKNSYPQSMLWLNSDDSFLERFIKFINIKMSNLFIIQTLEILHLIFTFLTFTFTSFTVCLTGNANTNKSLCWYFVCFIMALVAFLSGLAVIILIIIWQTINTPLLKDEMGRRIIVKKDFGWTFWTSVGILSLILLASSLILLHILIESLIYYFRCKKMAKHHKTLSKKKNNNDKLNYVYTANGIVSSNGNVLNECFQANNYNNLNSSKLPRLQSNYTPPPLPLLPSNLRGSKSTDDSSFNRKKDNKNNVDQFLTAQQEFNSPSYIFYTGHGQYRKQSITIDPDDKQIQLIRQQQQQLDYEFANDLLQQQQPQSHNYTLMNNSSNYTNTNNNHVNDHPYSNVNDPNHLNPNELNRFMNYR